jgi:transcriptional regulator with XRE-family HTH domain
MPRSLTAGQKAAARAAIARRGELGLSQKKLAEKSYVSERAIQNFEALRTWPNPDTLARLERLGLNWPVGYLNEYAIKHREHNDRSTVAEDIADIMESNLHPDLKLRLIDRLRAIDEPPTTRGLREQLAELERRLGEDDQKGSGIA